MAVIKNKKKQKKSITISNATDEYLNKTLRDYCLEIFPDVAKLRAWCSKPSSTVDNYRRIVTGKMMGYFIECIAEEKRKAKPNEPVDGEVYVRDLNANNCYNAYKKYATRIMPFPQQQPIKEEDI